LPRAFGRYQLFERIGVGGMAEIFLARASTELGASRLVVVKQMLPQLSDNDQFADLLIQEAKLAARLNHTNVVQVFDLGRHEGVLFIAMEYIEGFDLNELLRRCARTRIPLPIPFALMIVSEALRGLDYAHRRCNDAGESIGLVHRDVSPSNVLISFEGEVKLCDFGIARANDMAEALPEEVIKGKAGYMSPEQARGDPVDARSDIFSIGIILWELMAGRRLYKPQPGGPGLLQLAREACIPPLPSRGLLQEPQLDAIVTRALQHDPAQRFASAQLMLRHLEDYVARARLVANPLKLGEWLRECFDDQVVASRRAHERAAQALQLGPAAVIEPSDSVPPPPAPAEQQEVTGEREKPSDSCPSVEDPIPLIVRARLAPKPVAQVVPRPRRRPAVFFWLFFGVLFGLAAIVMLLLKR
jgi:eukaryotic-like serine/threonine-protein kinase